MTDTTTQVGPGQERSSGEKRTHISFGGKEYTARINTVGSYARISAHVLSLRSDPLKAAVEACKYAPSSQHPVIWEAAMKVKAQQASTATQDETRHPNKS